MSHRFTLFMHSASLFERRLWAPLLLYLLHLVNDDKREYLSYAVAVILLEWTLVDFPTKNSWCWLLGPAILAYFLSARNEVETLSWHHMIAYLVVHMVPIQLLSCQEDWWDMVRPWGVVLTVEWIDQMYQRVPGFEANGGHVMVALTGVLCSVLALSTVNYVCIRSSSSLLLLLRTSYLALVPAVGVEAFIRFGTSLDHNYNIYRSAALDWIITFLQQVETVPSPLNGRRYFYLLYWGAVILVALVLPFALFPRNAAHLATTLRRKYFHGVAIMLFAPVTVCAPSLQSLSYAIATALLLLLEGIRPVVPWLQQAFAPLLDEDKGEASSKSLVVSHIALIVGCGIPLWIQECLHTSAPEERLFLSLLGVLVLGVGDAMGAIVGVNFGRTRWSRLGIVDATTNKRTVEGSMGMFLSMLVVWILTTQTLGMRMLQEGSSSYWSAVVITFGVVTLVEAVTTQLDNLLLPLVGSATWVLLQQPGIL